MIRAATASPPDGWTCSSVLDTRLIGMSQCDLCGTRIRWVHVMEHPASCEQIEVGCCCAERLCYGYDATAAVRELKKKRTRHKRFVDRRHWRTSKRGNLWCKVRMCDEELTVTIYTSGERFGVCLAAADDDKWFSGPAFGNRKAAMECAFDLVEILRDEETASYP